MWPFSRNSSIHEFRVPTGQNFRIASDDGISISELAACLQSVVGFLHSGATSEQLLQYDDWWQHDGLHFPRAVIDFPKLLTMIESPAAIQRCTSDDFMVNVGIAPPDFTWYLRWYLADDDDRSVGGFDVTVPDSLVNRFESTVRRRLSVSLTQEDSGVYYARIRCAMQIERRNRSMLSRSIGDRILLAVIATPLAALSGWGTMMQVTTGNRPVGVLQVIGRIAIGQFVGGIFIVCVLALVWAFAAPAWLESHLQRKAALLLLTTMLVVPIIFLVVWFM